MTLAQYCKEYATTLQVARQLGKSLDVWNNGWDISRVTLDQLIANGLIDGNSRMTNKGWHLIEAYNTK